MNYVCQTAMILQILTERNEAPSVQPSALVAVPLFHVTGEIPLFLQSFALGRKLVLMPKWDATEALRLLAEEKITYFVGVPLMSYELATHPDRDQYDLSECKSFAAGGSPRPPEHVTKIKDAFPEGNPLLGYGLTETNAIGCGNLNENYLAKPGSTGMPSKPLVDLAILDEEGNRLDTGQVGEICIRSIANFIGYWRNEEATEAAFTKDAYFRTGDLGYLDEDDYLFIVDRKKDIIIRGGENIACIEVEEAIYAHPDVAECSVFGLPDERLGEVPAAVYLPARRQDAGAGRSARVSCRAHRGFQGAPVSLGNDRATAASRNRKGRQADAKGAVRARAGIGVTFSRIPDQRAIIDRRSLATHIEAAIGAAKGADAARKAVVDLLKQALDSGRAEMERRLLANPSAGHAIAGGLFLSDRPACPHHPRICDDACPSFGGCLGAGRAGDHGGGGIRAG